MKVAHIIFSFQIGGSESLLIDIANEQISFAEVSIIVINNDINEELVQKLNNRIHFIPLERKVGSKYNLKFIWRLFKYLHLKKPSIIHCHNSNIIPLLFLYQSKAIVTVHSTGGPIKYISKHKKIYSISNAVANDLWERTKLRSKVIHNGVKIKNYTLKNNYDIKDNFKIIQVGRLDHKIKGQEISIQAIAYLVKIFKSKKISLEFIGDGPSLGYLNDLVVSLELSNNVYFHGKKSRYWIERNLCKYDLLIQPSFYEGFGLSVVEGMASGLPVVASNVSGLSEVLFNMPSSFLFDIHKPNDINNKIEAVIKCYEDGNIRDLCYQSFIKAKEKFEVKRTANNYLVEYKKMVGHNYE